MKKVYTHTFSQGRLEADNKVNDYFERSLNLETENNTPICVGKISDTDYMFVVNGLQRVVRIGDRIQIKYEKNKNLINARGYLTSVNLDEMMLGNRKFLMRTVRDFINLPQHEPQHES